MFSQIFNVIFTIRFVVIAGAALNIIKFIASALYEFFLAPALGIGIDLKKTGKWAVVTGATDGIGKAYAESLAEKNFKVVLISRTQTKLDEVASMLQSKYNVETKTIAADFTKPDEIYNNIDKQLHDLDIGVLINNVGMYGPHPEYFLDLKNKDETYNNIIKCNIFSVTNMCQIVLPGMVERKRGVIVNVSSIAAVIPYHLATVYAATKSYILKFSEDLQTEYKKDGVTVQCLLTGSVSTKMSNTAPSWTSPTAAQYVKSAMATIGVKETTTGYFSHTLQMGLVNLFNAVSSRFTRWVIIRQILQVKANLLSDAKKYT